MKKFTSLFALLSCLCVVSAQAENEVTVYVYGSYPESQKFYWFDADDNFDPSPSWDASQSIYPPSFTELDGSIVKDGDIFYKKVLTPKNDGTKIKLILSDPRLDDPRYAKQTPDIELTAGSEYYFYYFGDDRYFTTSPINLHIAGNFNGWNKSELFDRESMTTWTKVVEAVNNELDFKILLNGEQDSDYRGYGQVKLNDPNGWISSNNGNFYTYYDRTLFNKYKITATWKPTSNFQDGMCWTLKIEGIGGALTINDGENFYDPGNPYIAASATYHRDFTYNWGTLCLPFEIKNSYEGVSFYKLSSVDRTNKTLSFTSISTVPAGEPVVYKVADDVALNFSETNAQVTTTPKVGETVDGWTLHGTWQSFYANAMHAGEYLYFFSNNKFWQATSSVNVPAFRAYFLATEDLDDNATQAPYRIQTDDVEGLQFVEQEDGTVKAYYDLQGRKLDGARKGLVIENGKIIMVK